MLKIVSIMGLICSVIVATSSYAVGLITYQKNLDTTGIINSSNIGVYSDAACTQNKTSISWGGCYPGDNKTAVLYVKNLGTTVSTLSIQALNWNPSTASSYLTLTSDYSGQTLSSGQVLLLTLKLSVSRGISSQITTFSFTVGIVSTG